LRFVLRAKQWFLKPTGLLEAQESAKSAMDSATDAASKIVDRP